MRETNSDSWSKVLDDQYIVTTPYIHPEYFVSRKSDEPGSRRGIDTGEFRTGFGQRGHSDEIGLGRAGLEDLLVREFLSYWIFPVGVNVHVVWS